MPDETPQISEVLIGIGRLDGKFDSLARQVTRHETVTTSTAAQVALNTQRIAILELQVKQLFDGGEKNVSRAFSTGTLIVALLSIAVSILFNVI